MSDYVKSTNFAIKDDLVTTDPSKIVKGTELDNEFNALSNAIASKANTNSPALTGTPTVPTATTGSNTTQAANTAYVKQEITAQGLGNMATQSKSAVDITGGTIVGITDLAVADGGTGASTLTSKAVLIGNGTSAITGISPGTSGNLLTSNGTDWTSAAFSSAGLAKAWVSFDASGTILKAYNVSSITVRGTGQWTINFTTAFADANYVMSGSSSRANASLFPGRGGVFVGFNWDGTNGAAPTTTSCQINTVQGTINGADGEYFNPARTTVVFFD